MVEEKKEEVKTITIWEMSRRLAELGNYNRNVVFSEKVYSKLYEYCLELDLDLGLVLRLLYTIDSDLVKEEGVQSKGVLPDQANKWSLEG